MPWSLSSRESLEMTVVLTLASFGKVGVDLNVRTFSSLDELWWSEPPLAPIALYKSRSSCEFIPYKGFSSNSNYVPEVLTGAF